MLVISVETARPSLKVSVRAVLHHVETCACRIHRSLNWQETGSHDWAPCADARCGRLVHPEDVGISLPFAWSVIWCAELGTRRVIGVIEFDREDSVVARPRCRTAQKARPSQ